MGTDGRRSGRSASKSPINAPAPRSPVSAQNVFQIAASPKPAPPRNMLEPLQIIPDEDGDGFESNYTAVRYLESDNTTSVFFFKKKTFKKN